ncbi:testin-like isoform X2 [Ptychodera flava]|uniref:testin-like isoform X2 n=1 Tax=Ptychodera flava TaxID=63121 RepID=UPI00396A2B34
MDRNRMTYPVRSSSPQVPRKNPGTTANSNQQQEREIAREDRQRIAPLHEVGAGAPCLKCGDACPGLDLHFWRKICRVCKCSQADHDIKPEKKEQHRKIGRLFGEDTISRYQVGSLSIERSQDPKSPRAPKETVTFEWVPGGATKEQVERYMEMIPTESQPIVGTVGAQQRDQQMMKQLPSHDQAPEFCDNLSDQEVKKLAEFVEEYKAKAVGIGQIREVIIQEKPTHTTSAEIHLAKGVPGTATPLGGQSGQGRHGAPATMVHGSAGPAGVAHSEAVVPGVRGTSAELMGQHQMGGQQHGGPGGLHAGTVQYHPGQEGAMSGQFAPGYGAAGAGASIHGTPGRPGQHAAQSGVAMMQGTPGGVAGAYDSGRPVEYGYEAGVAGQHGTPGSVAVAGGRPGEYAREGGIAREGGMAHAAGMAHRHAPPGGVAAAYNGAGARPGEYGHEGGYGTPGGVYPGAGDTVDTTRAAGVGVGGGELAEHAVAPQWECVRCNEPLQGGDVAVFAERAGPDKCWHPACFRCATCNELLVDLIYFYQDDKVYCGRHYADLHRPRCAACDELIFAREYTQAEDQNWHLKHFCCFDCDTLLGGKRYVPRDNHPYCLECYEKRFAKICQKCKQKIAADAQRLSHKEFHWHATDECFACSNCNKSLIGKQFMPKQGYVFCSVDCKRKLLS